ncbi:MAG: class I SAM-dependent methyltransferase [Gammaproteobacteria bacterium]|nr:class I SAM-dependent methyltransferase [Gammaproteobacteria bacterium]
MTHINDHRRQLLKGLLALLVLVPQRIPLLAAPLPNAKTAPVGNFRYIYQNPSLKKAFLEFYTNVFHLYPEHEFHRLVEELTQRHESDRDIYQSLQQSLNDISPFLVDLRFAVPALRKQKAEMTRQTLYLVDSTRTWDGYLEVGSTGRYISQLQEKLQIHGEKFLLHTVEPGYSPEDILERGQLNKLGKFVDMGNYTAQFTNTIPANSLDLVTVYIGFHHCPVDQREAFIGGLRDLIRPGGKLVLRDHDAHNEDLRRVAALAHDTFNAGTRQPWKANEVELRNFYSLDYIIHFLEKLGLRYDGRVFFQAGDPTRNGLMSFTRV